MTRDLYHAFLETPVELKVGALEINKNMLLWINDALMAVFFLLVGLEVKRELVLGSLASRQRAAFPVIAALGGMVVPALLFLAFTWQDPIARHGWAIPAATDIAFALAVLALLNIFNVRRIGIYILVGMVLWTAVLKSGVHATLAGVIVGFFVPLKPQDGKSPAKQLEHVLHPWVAFMILPLFAFANAGVSLGGVTLDGLTSVLPLGIIAGLFIGKPLGISLFCWLATKLKLASLPHGTTFKQIMAVGVLCGIGFTMSIFISTLAFGAHAPELIVWAKLGILIGSLLAAVIGYTLLKVKLSGQAVQA